MRRVASLIATGLVLAACGGKVQDEPSPGRTTSPGGGTTSSPPSTGTPLPTPTPTTTSPPAPSGPIPAGKVGQCGLYEGDAEANLEAFGRARAIAVYKVASVDEECSGAGGTHVTLARVGGCSREEVVHYGDHACMIDWQVGDLALVGVAPEPGAITTPGWCVDDLKWNGVARAVRKLDEGETPGGVLSRYACAP